MTSRSRLLDLGYIEGQDFTRDRAGNTIMVGDYVRCCVRNGRIDVNECRRIQSIRGSLIEINIMPPRVWKMTYEYPVFEYVDSHDFHRASRHNAAHKGANKMPPRHPPYNPIEEELKMAKSLSLYIAVRKFADYQSTVNRIEGDSPLVPQEDIMANTSYEALKQDVGNRIRKYPDEQWIITGATVLAEISAPPVTYRQL